MTIVNGTVMDTMENDDYILLQGVPLENGFFGIHATAPLVAETITVSILIESKSSNGETNQERQFAFRRSVFYGNTHISIIEIDLFGNQNLSGFDMLVLIQG